MSAPFDHAIRRAEPGDVGFVVATWINSYHQGSRGARLQRFALYKRPMRRLVLRVLSRAVTLVACDTQDPEHLFGWICGERSASGAVLHYVYVRETRRRVGLASELHARMVSELGPVRVYTHETDRGTVIANARWKRAAMPPADYNPFAAWEPRDEESAA